MTNEITVMDDIRKHINTLQIRLEDIIEVKATVRTSPERGYFQEKRVEISSTRLANTISYILKTKDGKEISYAL